MKTSDASTPKKAKPTWRCRLIRGTAWGVLFFLVGSTVAYFAAKTWFQYEIDAELARLRAEGKPVTPAELTAFCTAGMTENGAPELLAALQNQYSPASGTTAESILEPSCSGMELLAHVCTHEDELALLIPKNDAVFQKAKAALSKSDFYFAVDFSKGQFASFLHISVLRNAVKFLRVRAFFRTTTGDFAGAWEDAETSWRMAETMNRQALLIEYLVQRTLRGIAIHAMSDLCFASRPAPVIPRALANHIHHAIEKPSLLPRTLEGERIFFLQGLPKTLENGSLILQFCDDETKMLWSLAWFDGFLNWNELWYLRILRQYEKAAPLPYPALKRFIRQHGLDRTPSPTPRGCVVAQSGLFPTTIFTANFKIFANMRLAVIGLRLFADHLEGKPYPAALDAVPLPLAEDPFTGRRFLLKRADKKIILYSVGENERDDGGLPPPGAPKIDDIAFALPDD